MKKISILIVLIMAMLIVSMSTQMAVAQRTTPVDDTALSRIAPPNPSFVVLYHPPPGPIDTKATARLRTIAVACAVIDDCLKVLENEGIDEANVIGAWQLTDRAKVAIGTVNTVAVPTVPKKVWRKKP